VLFTPGPLTTSRTVKEAMLRDLGSRDSAFVDAVREIRARLLELGQVAGAGYEAVLMQGSGTFSVESVVSSVVPPDGKLLVAINGAYGRRIAQMAERLRIDRVELAVPEDHRIEAREIDARLEADPTITHVAVVHSETTTGILNPIDAIGEVVKARGRTFIVDAMSSFGGVPIDLDGCGIDFLVTSSNKCIQGVPGFGVILARREALLATRGYARSLSLDLLAQWEGLEASGQFRFTPPTHALLAFRQALLELEAEGGVRGRAARYRANHDLTVAGMLELGFETYLPPALQGYIITSFRYPKHPRFSFERLYGRLNEKGCVIYPGKVSSADCFRIGHIGHLFEADVRRLLQAMQESLAELEVSLR
jgi:2-aminoethylphosphonate-pyruvate transaminase